MKTKELIIAELLQAGHLKAEDAAILLTPTYQYVYLNSPQWITPYYQYPQPYYGITTNELTLN